MGFLKVVGGSNPSDPPSLTCATPEASPFAEASAENSARRELREDKPLRGRQTSLGYARASSAALLAPSVGLAASRQRCSTPDVHRGMFLEVLPSAPSFLTVNCTQGNGRAIPRQCAVGARRGVGAPLSLFYLEQLALLPVPGGGLSREKEPQNPSARRTQKPPAGDQEKSNRSACSESFWSMRLTFPSAAKVAGSTPRRGGDAAAVPLRSPVLSLSQSPLPGECGGMRPPPIVPPRRPRKLSGEWQGGWGQAAGIAPSPLGGVMRSDDPAPSGADFLRRRPLAARKSAAGRMKRSRLAGERSPR